MACRSGEVTVAPDWTFKIEGLMGTCGAPPPNVFGRWSLKSVKIGGSNVIDKLVAFEQGRAYNNVEIVVTDKPPQIELKVSGDDGQLTREYVAMAIPYDKTTWKQAQRSIRTIVPRTANALPGVTWPPGSPITPTGQPHDIISGLLAADYYVIALDDIDSEDAFDPAILEKLVSHATRVSMTTEGVVELSLQRFKVADLLR